MDSQQRFCLEKKVQKAALYLPVGKVIQSRGQELGYPHRTEGTFSTSSTFKCNTQGSFYHNQEKELSHILHSHKQ
ncbi:hypothetical protein TNCT_140741 [Trichonephila clavata]|uniref:Uncharacterized protein n=1 Tax=Trichonephila clavata TaxID=2740835 RepID=A0A8X6FPY8_TRICU|nr:hypothetical protein TNCT_140741 [Trichonephila clavata]